MRSFLTSVAVACALGAASVRAATSCNLESLVPLLADDRNNACFATSGIPFPPAPDAAPTAAQWKKTCGVQACDSLFSDLLDATPSECAIGQYAAHADIVSKYTTACGVSFSSSSNSPSSASSSSQDGGLSTMSLHSATGSGPRGEQDTVDTNAVTTPAPTTAAPTTAAPTSKSNSTTVVHALTSAAPAAHESLAVASSAAALLVASLLL